MRFVKAILLFFAWCLLPLVGFAIGYYWPRPVVMDTNPFHIQQWLHDKGYYAGIVDGRIGRQTIDAMQKAASDKMMTEPPFYCGGKK